MAEPIYKWRGKDLTYDQFMDGPGAKLSTDQAEAALDKASGATKTRRALQRAMTAAGYKKVEKAGDRTIYFEGNGRSLSFGTYGEVEKFLLENKLIKDEKAEAAKAAAEKKAKAKAKADAKKAADKKKLADKKAAEKAKAKASGSAQTGSKKPRRAPIAGAVPAQSKKRSVGTAPKADAKKEADKKKAAAKKAADKAKTAAKKTAPKKSTAVKKTTAKKTAAPAKKTAAKTTARKAVTAKKTSATKTTKAAAPKKTAAKKTATTAKKTAAAKRGRTVSTPKNLDDNLIIKVGKRNYTQKRLHDLALDTYKYDMGKDPKKAKTVKTTVLADQKKCQFVVNGKEKGEFNL